MVAAGLVAGGLAWLSGTPVLAADPKPEPYRRGLELTAALGGLQCLPGSGFPCVPALDPAWRPTAMFDFGAGYRIGRYVSLGVAMAFVTRRTGFADADLSRQRRRDLLATATMWWPLWRTDLGLGFAAGRRDHALHFGADVALSTLEYTGWTWRPSVHVRHWVLVDYAIGAKLVALVDGNAGICVTSAGERVCAADLGPVPAEYRQTTSLGLLFAIDVAGVATPY